MPPDPPGRWAVRAWQKYVDDHVAASVSELAWQAFGIPAMAARDRPILLRAIERIPAKERRDAWTAALAGASTEQLARASGRVADTIRKTEADLAGTGWLAGSAYSLADIAAFPFLNYLPTLMPERMNESVAPRTTAWLKKIAARPAVRAALALGRAPDAYAIAAPGPEQVRWG
jgi:glutathione S-transferase